VDVPSVVDGMPADEYHRHPALSSSGARRLLPPGCPALFRYEQDHPPARRDEFDFGHAAHQRVLGAGPELVLVEAADWRTKAAKEARDAAHAEGKVPLLPEAYQQVHDMAEAIAAHPLAGALFAPGSGEPERSLFWTDRQSGVDRRARLDWQPHATAGRMLVPDYKTSVTVDEDELRRAIHRYGYHQQAAWYLDGIAALGLADEARFLFVFQLKTPPYLVRVVEPDELALRIGRDLNRQAIDLYAECERTGRWPGYDDVTLISLPGWVENAYLQEMSI
jgi:hypothetical protein